MKVYEMEPKEIGWAVEVPDRDAIIITLTKENRVLILSRSNKELVVSEVRLQDISKKNGMKETVPKKVKRGAKKIHVSSFDHRKELKYLPVKEHDVLGKTLNTSLALTVYKHYGVRLWSVPTTDIVSSILKSQEQNKDFAWIKKTISDGLIKHGIPFSMTKHNAYVMFLKGIGVIVTKRDFSKKVQYVVNKEAISAT